MVMLITSRETRRLIIPKGWVENGINPAHQAALEAREEAGVIGSIGTTPVGVYRYQKALRRGARIKTVPCIVDVYLLMVDTQLDDWKEKGQRERRWLDPSLAAELVSDKKLGPLIRKITEDLH